MFVCGAIALYLFIALLTYTPADPGWSYSGAISGVANRGGVAGAWFADVFLHLFGYLSYLVPAMLAYSAWLVLKKRSEFEPRQFAVRMAGFIQRNV